MSGPIDDELGRAPRAGRFSWYVITETKKAWRDRGSPTDSGYGLFLADSIRAASYDPDVWLDAFPYKEAFFLREREANAVLSASGDDNVVVHQIPPKNRPAFGDRAIGGAYGRLQQNMLERVYGLGKYSAAAAQKKPKRESPPQKRRRQKPPPVKKKPEPEPEPDEDDDGDGDEDTDMVFIIETKKKPKLPPVKQPPSTTVTISPPPPPPPVEVPSPSLPLPRLPFGFLTIQERLKAYIDDDYAHGFDSAMETFGFAIVRRSALPAHITTREYVLESTLHRTPPEDDVLDTVYAREQPLTLRVVVRSHLVDQLVDLSGLYAENIDVPQGWVLLMEPLLYRSAPPLVQPSTQHAKEEGTHRTVATAWLVTPQSNVQLRFGGPPPADLASLGSMGIICSFYHQAMRTRQRMMDNLEAVAYGTPLYEEMVRTMWKGDAENNPHAVAQRRVEATLDQPVYATYDTKHRRWADERALREKEPPRTASTALTRSKIGIRTLCVPEFWPFHSERTPALQRALLQNSGCAGAWHYDVSERSGRFRFARRDASDDDGDDDEKVLRERTKKKGKKRRLDDEDEDNFDAGKQIPFELPGTMVGWFSSGIETPPWDRQVQPPDLATLRRWMIHWRGEHDGAALLLRYGVLYPTTRQESALWLDDPTSFQQKFAAVDAQPWSAVTWPGGDAPPPVLSEKEKRDMEAWKEFKRESKREQERKRYVEEEQKKEDERLRQKREEQRRKLIEENRRREEARIAELKRQEEERDRELNRQRREAREQREREMEEVDPSIMERLQGAIWMQEMEKKLFGDDADFASLSRGTTFGSEMWKQVGQEHEKKKQQQQEKEKQQQQQQQQQQQEQEKEKQQQQQQEQEKEKQEEKEKAGDDDDANDDDDETKGQDDCSAWIGWDWEDNSCFIDSALMMALAPGNYNPLREALITAQDDDTPQQTELRAILLSSWDAVRQAHQPLTCMNIRTKMAEMSPDHSALMLGGNFEDAHEVIELLHVLLVGQHHRLCEERQRLVASSSGGTTIERRALPSWPMFETAALLGREEDDNEDVLEDYDPGDGRRTEKRQSLQRLVNRYNDFTMTQRGGGANAIAVQKSLTMQPHRFDYVTIYLNRKRGGAVLARRPVVFPRVLTIRTLNGACPDSGDVPLRGAQVKQRRYVLMAVASYEKRHWTMVFRCDGPMLGEDRTPLEPPSDVERWFLYDDIDNQGVRPIAKTYDELLRWGPTRRSKEYLQKMGTLFYYVHVPENS